MAQKTDIRLVWEIVVRGIVQGVGFRPFVQRLARNFRVAGFVKNESGHVYIQAAGRESDLRSFLRALEEGPPAGARIDSLDVADLSAQKPDSAEANEQFATAAENTENFVIAPSSSSDDRAAMMTPDIAVCADCLRELMTTGDPRHGNPFISCAVCGPRYSIAETLPYDRESTAMRDFEMCPLCQSQYADPSDRRCHAQTVCCNGCGPVVSFEDRGGRTAFKDSALYRAAALLKAGGIVAVKGIGGFHFACTPFDDTAVKKLRELKGREDKPFAVMFPGLVDIKKFCRVGEKETELLLSPARPIVLLDRLIDDLSEGVCRGSRYLGAFLPYTPLQHLLLRETGPLVLTSANVSSQPMMKDDEEIRRFIQQQLLDGVLTHDRKILRRLDDSVTAVVNGKTLFIRRARGYVPLPVSIDALKDCPPLLCCGAQQKSVVCLTSGPLCYQSAEIGDLDSAETLAVYRETVRDMTVFFHLAPAYAVCDLHPDYASAQYARETGLPVLAVQHHFAHIASVMAAHNVTGPVIGAAFDSTGYGADGSIWGGEFLIASPEGYVRAGHLKSVKVLGGDTSVRQGWKTAVCLLEDAGVDMPGEAEPEKLTRAALKSGVNTIRSSSMGRVFDAVSALLGICMESTYEGQGAVMLENAAASYQEQPGGDAGPLPFELIRDGGELVADLAPCVRTLAAETELGVSPPLLALRFHRTVTKLIVDMCLKLREDSAIATVCLGGGVFQNRILLEETVPALVKAGFEVLLNEKVPPNDGGIALGQAWAAWHMIKKTL